MDRVQFVGCINGYKEDQFFDHTMIAYNIINGENDISISQDIDHINDIIVFRFSFVSNEAYERVCSRIANEFNGIVSLYGSSFDIGLLYANDINKEISIKIKQL